MNAPIRYARSGEVNIAYQVTGEGPFDLVLVKGFFSHLELDWESPAYAHFLERLGIVRAADLLRQARDGALGPRRRAAGLRDAHGRRARGHGRGRERVRGALRLLGGRPAGRPLRHELSASGHAPSRSTGRTPSAAIPMEDYPWAPTRRGTGPGRRGLRAHLGREHGLSRRWRRTPTQRCEPGSTGAAARG